MRATRIIDAFTDLLAYGLTFRDTLATTAVPYEDVRQTLENFLTQSETYVTHGLCAAEDYELARYAICAWVDETVLASDWPARARWRSDLLQRRFYQSTNAGQQFYDRLDSLTIEQKDVREVFYMCLTLGFQGRYCTPESAPQREALKQRHLKLLFGGTADTPTAQGLEKSVLFPAAYPKGVHTPGPDKQGRRFAMPWVFFIAPLATVSVLFTIYRFTLYSVGDNILKGLR